MPITAADFSSTMLGALARATGLAAIVVGAALALMFAFAAALVVGLIILGAALALRLTPRRTGAADVLDAHHTPDGWVVETRAQRKS